MTSGYMVVAKDGKEYGPLDRDTIQRWFFESRLERNSKVWEPGKHHFRLHEMFDLTLWSSALVNTAPPGAPPVLSYMPMRNAGEGAAENQRTSGMVAAAILLLINGVLGLLSIGVVLLQKLDPSSDPSGFVVPVVDLVVAMGLLRGKERFKKWGLIRAILGGVFVVLRAPFATSTPTAGLELVFQLIFCAGIIVLLAPDSPSNLKVGIGVAAVLFAWSGIFTTYVVAGLVRGMNELQSANYSVPEAGLEAGFEDLELGVKVRLPKGWALMTGDSRFPGATMVAIHNQSGCTAVLIAEPAQVEAESLDEYLTSVMQARQEDAPDLKELGRNDWTLGGNPSRMVEASWTSDGKRLRGFTSACKSGWSYHLLSGWCLDENVNEAFAEYIELVSAFEIKGGRPLTEETTSQKRSRKRGPSKK